MNKKKKMLHALGFIIIALGISSILTSQLGASPIDAFNYFLHKIVSKILPALTIGTVIIFTGLVVTLLAYIFNKDKNMIVSAVFLFVVGVFVDFWLFVLGYIPDSVVSNLVFRIVLATSGMLLCAFGVSITILTGLPASPYERMMLVVHTKIKSLALSKIMVEGSFFLLAILLGVLSSSLFEQVNVFTVIMTFSIGPLISVYIYIIKRKLLKERLKMEMNKYIDHTKLGANVSKAQIDQLIEEAKTYEFKSVCINPVWVKYAAHKLKKTDVLVCTVIGFPHGTHHHLVKAYETLEAVNDGADEIDMVINVQALKSKDYHTTLQEIKGVVENADGRCVKVIIETCYLTEDEIVKACELAVEAKATFVKTSTGFGTGGATVEHVKLMKKTVKDNALVKASGGVRTFEDATKMILAGASRIGTSNGVDIVNRRSKENDTNTTY